MIILQIFHYHGLIEVSFIIYSILLNFHLILQILQIEDFWAEVYLDLVAQISEKF